MATKRSKRYWLRTLLALAALGGLLAGGLAWLASSETAFAWALARVQAMSGGKLKVAGVHGTVFGPIAIDRIEYADESLQVRVSDVRLTWSPWALMRDRLAIDATSARQVSLRIFSPEGEASKPPAIPNSVGLPLRVSIDHASVSEMEITSSDSRIHLRDISLGYEGDRRAHRVRSLRVVTDWGILEASGELGGRDPYPVTAKAVLQRTREQDATLALSGTLRRLEAHADADFDGVRANADATMKPFEAIWLEKFTARAANIDLAPLLKGAPTSDVSLSMSAASRDAQSVVGNLQASNAIAGSLDEGRLPARKVEANFVTDFRMAKLESIEIGMVGGGRLSGSGEFSDGRTAVALDAHAINLKAVYARLLATELNGRIDAAFAASGETVHARLVQGPLSVLLDAARHGSELEIRSAHLTARSGRVDASGRLVMGGDMPMTAKATFAGFDPSEWGSYPAADVNGTFDLQGVLARRSGTLSFTLAQSRFRTARAAGKGVVRVTDQRIDSADIMLEIGANRLTVRGAFGAAGDALALSVSARRLAELDPRIQGRVDITAKARGTWSAPTFSFTASGVDVRLQQSVAVGVFGASGAIEWAAGGPLRVDAEGTNVTARGLAGERVTLHAKGTRAQHAIDVAAKSNSADFAARLVGGWYAGRGWVGTLAALENRGAFDTYRSGAANRRFQNQPGNYRGFSYTDWIFAQRYDCCVRPNP